jgi:hypothetical protein
MTQPAAKTEMEVADRKQSLGARSDATHAEPPLNLVATAEADAKLWERRRAACTAPAEEGEQQ